MLKNLDTEITENSNALAIDKTALAASNFDPNDGFVRNLKVRIWAREQAQLKLLATREYIRENFNV